MQLPTIEAPIRRILAYCDTTQPKLRPSHAWQIGYFLRDLPPTALQALAEQLVPEGGARFKAGNLLDMQRLAALVPAIDNISDRLSWTHYRLLLRVPTPEARQYYLEAALQYQWSTRQLHRQIRNHYFERRQTAGIRPMLDHYVLEFTQRLRRPHRMPSEQALENALILQLQDFLLELGDDLAFMARQKQIRIESGRSFFVDLLLYHLRFKCFLVIELKTVPFNPQMV
ncbi:MAG: DUF1016 family protein, partial [Phaeodactylibacter sp.]|nr:DUF1016 family protein [Phaeodactylibacter sp.]